MVWAKPVASTSVDSTSRYTARAAKPTPINRRVRRCRSTLLPVNSQITTVTHGSRSVIARQ
jgi:hypothetical protein